MMRGVRACFFGKLLTHFLAGSFSRWWSSALTISVIISLRKCLCRNADSQSDVNYPKWECNYLKRKTLPVHEKSSSPKWDKCTTSKSDTKTNLRWKTSVCMCVYQLHIQCNTKKKLYFGRFHICSGNDITAGSTLEWIHVSFCKK